MQLCRVPCLTLEFWEFVCVSVCVCVCMCMCVAMLCTMALMFLPNMITCTHDAYNKCSTINLHCLLWYCKCWFLSTISIKSGFNFFNIFKIDKYLCCRRSERFLHHHWQGRLCNSSTSRTCRRKCRIYVFLWTFLFQNLHPSKEFKNPQIP